MLYGVIVAKLLLVAGIAAALMIGAAVGQAPDRAAVPEPPTTAPAAVNFLNPGPATPTALGPARPPELDAAAADWPAPAYDLAGTRANLAASIDATNVGTLEEVWQFPVAAQGGWGGMTSSVLVVGETVYVHDMESNVFALDRETGSLRWEHRYDIPSGGPNGVAIGYGLIFGTTGDEAGVFALDAVTGQEVWRVRLAAGPATSTDMAPLVYDRRVYVSTTPCTTAVCYQGGQRGILHVLDAATGATFWTFDTTTDNLWGNPAINSGGGLWYPPAVDEAGNLYFGTGNAGPWPGIVVEGTPYPSGASRPGANDYASSIVSLAPNGAVRWHHNAKPHDLFDHDFQLTPILATVEIDGTPVDLAIGGGKVGVAIAVDRQSGRIVWKTAMGRHENDDLQRIPEGETVEVYPSGWGVTEAPMAYADGLLFVPTLESGQAFTGTTQGEPLETFPEIGGGVVALDVRDGSVAWEVDLGRMNVCALTVANDVLFTAALDGVLRALDPVSGRELWSAPLPAGCNGSPAVAGDLLIVPAAGPLVAAAGEAQAAAAPAVVAFRLE